MDKETKERINRMIDGSDFILAGIGEELAEPSEAGEDSKQQIIKVYGNLPRLFRGRPYFILTQNRDDLIFRSKIPDLFLCAPYCTAPPEKSDQAKQWSAWLNWFSSVPSKKACLMLLGVGILQPQLIRWPFEKAAQIAEKSSLITVHHSLAFLPEKTGERGIAVKEYAADFIREMTEEDLP